jgi:hypothetical protein
MTDAKHTLGPWTAERDPSHFDTLSTVTAGEKGRRFPGQQMIVQVGGFAETEEQEANARLIASAPDLLEALLAAEDKHQRGILNMTDAEIERVHTLRRAAIARATGEAA